ncbi:MAG TPA: hypothetical protein ENI79_01300 [Rhodospirillales bacterium]|nr:hypothetical protein [Rhodospirillales bacterium]
MAVKKGASLPTGNRVSRGCKNGFDKGIVTSAAFELRTRRNEKELSSEWIECHSVTPNEKNPKACATRQITREYKPLKPQPFATLPVEDVRSISGLDVIYRPTKNIPCHCGISGLTGDSLTDFSLQEKLATLANNNEIIDRS